MFHEHVYPFHTVVDQENLHVPFDDIVLPKSFDFVGLPNDTPSAYNPTTAIANVVDIVVGCPNDSVNHSFGLNVDNNTKVSTHNGS